MKPEAESMTGKSFELNETTLPVIEELGRHMPGGFFIYRAEAPEELLYANKACFDIFGCNGPEDFKAARSASRSTRTKTTWTM